ncbi:MAG: RNA-binding cell elongation regulator Jag/EloR [Coriobacteriales bacterium]|nr:RNA-binding cell elongation regulator Jag/EloR [Coriobacteriales bacterium]
MSTRITITQATLDEALDLASQQLNVAIENVLYDEIESEDNQDQVTIEAWAEDGEDDEVEGVSEEELDHIADTAIAFLRQILPYFGAENAEIDEYEGDEGELILDIVGQDLAVLIGRYGKNLDALQQLTSSIVNRKLGFKYSIVIDVEGYKSRRRVKLESIAESGAARAIKRHGEVRLHPMSPAERRIIHITLRDNPEVETFSEGEGPNRRVVIRAL